ncbi:F0F1 ATP synthase subunit B [Granulicatella sp. zg-ZJ]|uniref:F0F1 ATP synthase subunit B n=1 Tax=unclassified Granulicatella TaxID=2630493 RepID=UPI0013C1DF1D|nr:MULTISPECIES: F0F1 ATP synthase subunit B [unclassified Granulicatella]MBS4749982.1 F0F1 ATP synthase subunit B [Carnobacteriaceae bacterium zg-ZUI78]NEW63094.1 F0F1 ATP synthase subunit B [Granulicatella sp. zg-ZJ]NEW66180.1 F0F1 ATP synthase subunit B [Granulicatella sp. zg-84]QMI86063.1 F0F1 ATP synthase subunit B [Carnobacteriaceae bacterium zg-84]
MNSIILSSEQTSVSSVLGNSLVILVSFLILLFILSKFSVGPILKMMEKREKEVNDQLDNAQRKEEEAISHEKEAKAAIHEAQLKSQHLITKAKETGEKIKDDASRAARQETIRIRQEAQEALEHEREATMASLTEQVAGMSVELTEKLLKREITQQDHQALIDEFIEGLEK